jgi:hypothetical protein
VTKFLAQSESAQTLHAVADSLVLNAGFRFVFLADLFAFIYDFAKVRIVGIKGEALSHEADGCFVYSIKLVDVVFHFCSAVCAS